LQASTSDDGCMAHSSQQCCQIVDQELETVPAMNIGASLLVVQAP